MANVWATVANSSAARRMNLFIVGSIEKFCHCVCKALSWFTDHADLMHGKPTTLAPIVRRGECTGFCSRTYPGARHLASPNWPQLSLLGPFSFGSASPAKPWRRFKHSLQD